MRQWIEDKLMQFYEWLQSKWFLWSLILTTSGFWFSLVLAFWGENLNLITIDNGSKKFTPLGFVFTIFFVILSLILFAAQKLYEYRKINSDQDKRKLYILENICICTSQICDNKFINLKKLIYEIKTSSLSIHSQIISRPCEQLKYITEKINRCLCRLLTQNEYSINEDELYVSLYYSFPLESDEWYLAENTAPERGLCIEKLLDDKSTFSKCLSSKKPLVFWNSKEKARKNDSYIPDEDDAVDDNEELKGSIGCYRITITHNNKELIKSVLSITTYNKKFVNSKNKKIIENVEYNIENHILQYFKKRINVELCLLYLSHLYSPMKESIGEPPSQ